MIKQMVQMKNRGSGLLMETGVTYNKQRLHKVGYFAELMATNEDVQDPVLKERLRRLRTVPGVGPITALTSGALEIVGVCRRFRRLDSS